MVRIPFGHVPQDMCNSSLGDRFKIHAPFGQHYTPVDHDSLMKYSEARMPLL